MKLINKLLFLSLFLVVFISCQNEIVEIIQPSQEDVLQANTTVTNLVQRTVTKDGSNDNIIDNASCISVQLPITVTVNGLEIIVDSEEDFEVIEAIFDEFDDDDDHLDILFPIVIILSDFSEITIHNFNELENFSNQCEGENETDDDIECLDFVYPISLSIFDSANQLAQTITVNSDEDFYEFIDDIGDHHIVQLKFPITVVYFDGTEETISHMRMLKNAIEAAKNLCDEDDDNDFDDDDCMHCTNDQITELLISCEWMIDKIKIEGEDRTDEYMNYLFTFLEDGTLIAKVDGSEITGTWEVSNSGHGMGMGGSMHNKIIVTINLESLPDFSFSWILYEIEDDNEIDFRFDHNRLELEKKCL